MNYLHNMRPIFYFSGEPEYFGLECIEDPNGAFLGQVIKKNHLSHVFLKI